MMLVVMLFMAFVTMFAVLAMLFALMTMFAVLAMLFMLFVPVMLFSRSLRHNRVCQHGEGDKCGGDKTFHGGNPYMRLLLSDTVISVPLNPSIAYIKAVSPLH